jgi:putative peptidoglycan lipid II flippase
MATAPPLPRGGSRGGGGTQPPPPEPAPDGGDGGAARSTARAAGLTIALVLVSRVTGVVREMVLAHQFGQTQETTLYNVAFNVPDLIALVIAGGALSSVFVPVFAQYWNDKKEDDAWRVFGTVITIAAVAVAALVIGMELAVVPITALLNRDYSPAEIARTAHFSAILLPAQWCLLVGGLMMGTLYARKRFLVPGLGPILYNLGTIIGGLSQAFVAHPDISAMAWGTTIGAFVGSILLPVWDLSRVGVRWRPSLDIHHEGVRNVGRLMIPVLLGLSLSQLIMWITARCLPADDRYTALKNAYTLTQLPIGIFAQAFGIVLLPTISTYAAQKAWPEFRTAISEGIKQVFFLTLPASLLMSALALPLVRALYLGGKFTDADAHVAATALIYYSLGTFAWSGIAILARGFYARQDTWTPVFITTPMVFVFWGLGLLSVRLAPNGTGSVVLLAASASVVGAVTMLLFLILLQKKVGGLKPKYIALSALRIVLASAIAAAAAWFVARWFERTFEPTKLQSFVTLAVAGGLGIAIYGGIAVALGYREVRTIRDMFRRGNRPAGAPADLPPAA